MPKKFIPPCIRSVHTRSGVASRSLAVAVMIVIAWTAAGFAAGQYQTLTEQALTAFQNATQSIRGMSSQKRILDATQGFYPYFTQAEALKAKPIRTPLDNQEIVNVLRSIAAQRSVLQSAVELAEADDRRTVVSSIVNQAVAAKLAENQKAADRQFLARIDEILSTVRQDLG